MPRSMHFPETMIGYVTFPPAESATGSHKFTMRVRWFIPDLDAFLADPRHRVLVTGTVRCQPLGGTLTVAAGEVELFAVDDGVTVMNYRLYFEAGNGEPLELRGAKRIVDDPGVNDLWPDTTTLRIKVRQSRPGGDLVLSGDLHLTVPRVLRSIVGMRASGPAVRAVRTILAFDWFFVRRLFGIYVAAVRRPALDREPARTD